MTDQFFGWELLFNNVKNDIKKKEDVLMLLIHYSLIKSGFKCIGIDDDWKSEVIEISSELLPEGWNVNKEFVFRYQYDNEKYILRSCHSDESTIVFNFMHTEKLKVYNVMFNYEKSVSALEGNISSVLPSYVELFNIIRKDLVSPFVNNEKKTVETQTSFNETFDKKSDRILAPMIPQPKPYQTSPFNLFPPFQPIGRSDLDPLAAVSHRSPLTRGGGMLFDPFQENRNRLLEQGRIRGPGVPQRLPRGAAPPGSRFDPFGPPDANPDSGRFPPEYDDMFS